MDNMPAEKSAHARRLLNKAKSSLELAGARLSDKHLKLAVTGLSKSGKTAFITSLLNQLLEINGEANLPFLSVVREKRIIGVKRAVQEDLTTKRFAYEDALRDLAREPAQWPQSTSGISQVRLIIRYHKKRGLSKLLMADAQLILDITDYPGEWLLDLPLLSMSYAQWCEQCQREMHSPKRQVLAQALTEKIAALDINAPADEVVMQTLAGAYAQYLHACQQAGFQLLQPGRFLLPGELHDAPVLHFFPLSDAQLNHYISHSQQTVAGSYLDLLERRFTEYKKKVVAPFYEQHFKRFDRQIILVDCLSALNFGAHSFADLQLALTWIMRSFNYGKSSIVQRLFNPKIDKLVFAASKADHIGADQQINLVKLLDSLLHEARQQLQFVGVVTESTAIAAIRATKNASAELNGERVQVVQGRNIQGESVTLFPGDVPSHCPSDRFWQEQGFDFPQFSPPSFHNKHVLEHIRMDQIIEFILADKLQ
jgi:uncharacterized protein